ncbi:MAG: DpnI domain-containing protein [Clostridia bacterium]|nr:DpnI domain-containing protein [Clostridia bacterium]
MNLDFDASLAEGYRSGSQIARVVTENWMSVNMYCPRCGNIHISHFENNRPVADFFCPACKNEFELKSKGGSLGKKINDGAYDTMIERITSNNNPDFFFMSYSKSESKVVNLVFVPKYFFIPAIIEKRKPLSPDARRAGWTGCNILIDEIPEQGRIDIVSGGVILPSDEVVSRVNKSKNLETRDITSRGWLMDILKCVNRIPTEIFSLQDVYSFEGELSICHPDNNNIKPKIRQQLQLLRGRGFIEFLGNGVYKKTI